jgi:hypothetical protein
MPVDESSSGSSSRIERPDNDCSSSGVEEQGKNRAAQESEQPVPCRPKILSNPWLYATETTPGGTFVQVFKLASVSGWHQIGLD